MLDLEVVPERSLGNGEWEFVLGSLKYKRLRTIVFNVVDFSFLQI